MCVSCRSDSIHIHAAPCGGCIQGEREGADELDKAEEAGPRI